MAAMSVIDAEMVVQHCGGPERGGGVWPSMTEARPDGHAVDGMLLFYGWNEEAVPQATAFLCHEP